jgi:hypothetical protein
VEIVVNHDAGPRQKHKSSPATLVRADGYRSAQFPVVPIPMPRWGAATIVAAMIGNGAPYSR